MNPVDRRSFLRTASVALGAGLATRLTPSTWAKPLGANDDVRVAVIGLRSKGSEHIKQLLDLSGVRIVALCDVDPLVLWREVAKLKEKQINVFAATDAREIFDRSDVDAVVIATSNHWHALLTVWACQAGKDVYVEKPVSHTVWEGRKMVEAADTYKRIVQAGTQYRSDVAIPEAIAYLNEGHVGKMLAAHTTIYKRRESIGKKLPWYPDWLDYDMFCGPTPAVPLERDRIHYDWHWMWRTGNGELGNNGVHVLDIARRFAGHDGLPSRVMSLGGRYLVDDDSFLILNDNRVYGSRFDPETDLESFSIFFRPGMAEEVLGALQTTVERVLDGNGAGPQPVEFSEALHPHDSLVSPVLRYVQYAVRSGVDDGDWYEEQFHFLLERMLAHHRRVIARTEQLPALKSATRREVGRRLALAVDLVHARYESDIGLADMAKAACLSKFHFLRLFTELHGLTPHAYLQRKRALAAARLLQAGSHSATAVAARTGFNSRATMGRQLRRWSLD
jgi:predicted dehydrogenase/AraC-like DNA-binding protein